MNHSSAIKLFTALLAGGLFLSSCEHEPAIHKKPFKIQTATWYRVSPTTPAPIEVNGAVYTSFVNFPGAGAGTLERLEVIAWATDPHHDNYKSLKNRMIKFVAPRCDSKNIAYVFASNDMNKGMLMHGEIRQNIYLVFKVSKYDQICAGYQL